MGDMIYDKGDVIFTGDIVDSTLLWGYFIGRVNSTGYTSCVHNFIDSTRVKQLVFAPIIKVSDDFYVAMGFAWRKSRFMLVAFNSNCDTLFTKEYLVEPDDSLDYQVITDMIHIPGKGYVAVGSAEAYNTKDSLHSQVFVMRLDEDFNLLWQSQYGSHFHEIAEQVDYLGNDTLLVFGVKSIENFPTHNSPIQSPLLFYKISLTDGELLWQKINENEIRSTDFDFVKTADGGYILNSSEIIDRYYNDMRPGNFFFRNSVFKIGKDFNYKWEVNYGEKTITPYNLSWDILPAIEGDGVVNVGSIIDTSNDEGFIRAITKVNWDGDSIWTRYYQPFHIAPGVSKYFPGGDDKILPTENGYIIGVNMAFDTLKTEYAYVQQIWFLAIDELGCYIPGCQLSTTDENIYASKNHIIIYPNPSSDISNILLKGVFPDHTCLRLFDNLGSEIFKIKDVKPEINYILNVSDLSSGIYNLVIEHQGEIIILERMLVVH